jgi:hypothetical protein
MNGFNCSIQFALALGVAWAQATQPVVLTVDIENAVAYRSDIADPNRRGSDVGMTTAGPNRAFTDVLYIGDIVAVNGKPAKGLWTSRQYIMNFNPNPAPGFAVADVARGTIAECKWEFQDADGRFIGALADSGLAPHAVTGGLGAFFGMRGQMAGGTSPVPKPIRNASMSEDPSLRRQLGGGNNRVIFHLLPDTKPWVEAVLHSNFIPVSAADPARPGETLIIAARGLGPLVPGTTPAGAAPFPDPAVEVNSPVEVSFGGVAAPVINKVGWPGETNLYRVEVRVPANVPSGMVNVMLTAAWIPSDHHHIPVRN